MKAIVLAAGCGKRMQGYAPEIPKVMLPMSDGKPIIDHVIKRLTRYGLEPIIAISRSGYGERIRKYFNGNNMVTFSETNEPSGTAGEVYQARGLLKGEKTFLVYYGDIVADVDLYAMQRMHGIGKNIITLCGRRVMESPEGLMKQDGERVVFVEKPTVDITKLGYDAANCPIFFAERDVLNYIDRMRPEYSTELDFSKHIFPALSSDRKRMQIYVHDGFYYNVSDGKVAEAVKTLDLDF